MAIVHWEPKALSVQQEDTVEVLTLDGAPANNIFTLTVNGIDISVPGNTSVDQTAADLATAWSAETHPYFNTVQATATGAVVTLKALTAGVPYLATSSVSGGGTGTIGPVTPTVISSGPYDVSLPENYSTGALPLDGDTLIAENTPIGMIWNLDALAGIVLLRLIRRGTHGGSIGLNTAGFATSPDGRAIQSSAAEYRPAYLSLEASQHDISIMNGLGAAPGGDRLLIDTGATATKIIVFDNTVNSVDGDRPTVRLLANNAGTVLDVRGDQGGGVGIGIDQEGETSLVGDISCNVDSSNAHVIVGEGVAWSNFFCVNGTHSLQAANTPALIQSLDGVLTLFGSFALTKIDNLKAHVIANNTGGILTSDLNDESGLLDGTDSALPRVWDVVNANAPRVFTIPDNGAVTINTINRLFGQANPDVPQKVD